MLCSICFNKIEPVQGWEHGNNAEPVNMGRCCNRCDNEVVIPARLRLMTLPNDTYMEMLEEQHEAMTRAMGPYRALRKLTAGHAT